MSLPLFMLAVQNAVSHSVMGIATSTMQFLRAVGGTMGVAIMGSLINSTLATEMAANTPRQVTENAPPTLLNQLSNPQFLLSPEQRAAVQDAFGQLGPQGAQLYQDAILAVKTSLATAISDAFWVAMFVVLASVFVGIFLKEIPLRRVHELEGEPSATAPAAPAPRPPTLSASLTPAPDDSNAPASRRPMAYAAVGAVLAFIAAVAAFLIRRNGS
jgi:hypothetical protein